MSRVRKAAGQPCLGGIEVLGCARSSRQAGPMHASKHATGRLLTTPPYLPISSLLQSRSPAPAAASQSASYGSAAAGLSAEQREFLERKARESRSFSAPAPTRGRSSTPRRR